MKIWSYSELDLLLQKNPELKNGLIIDTNILISATYEIDRFHDESVNFLEHIIDLEIPIFCNVNVRAEFLEIHRRILFSEAILDFEEEFDKKILPSGLSGLLTNYRARTERRKKSKPDDPVTRLSEAEIKEFRNLMIQVSSKTRNLWLELCNEKISDKLGKTWINTQDSLGLNFLSLREDDQKNHLNEKPDWLNVTRLMGDYGVSSSDAMILNMFFVSKFSAIASSDRDIGFVVVTEDADSKICIVPDYFERKY